MGKRGQNGGKGPPERWSILEWRLFDCIIQGRWERGGRMEERTPEIRGILERRLVPLSSMDDGKEGRNG